MLGRITKNFELSPKKMAASVNLCHAGNKFAVTEGEASSVDFVRFPLKRSLEDELDKIQDKRICLGNFKSLHLSTRAFVERFKLSADFLF